MGRRSTTTSSAPVKQAPVQSTRPVDVRPPAATRVVAPDREVGPIPQPVVRAPKAAPPAPPKAAARTEVEQPWQPPRPKQASAPARPEYSRRQQQRNAEAKLAEALWPEGEQKKKAKSEEGKARPAPRLRSVRLVVCVGLWWWLHDVQLAVALAAAYAAAVGETTTMNPTETLGPTTDGKPDPRNATNGAAGNMQNQSASAQQPGIKTRHRISRNHPPMPLTETRSSRIQRRTSTWRSLTHASQHSAQSDRRPPLLSRLGAI